MGAQLLDVQQRQRPAAALYHATTRRHAGRRDFAMPRASALAHDADDGKAILMMLARAHRSRAATPAVVSFSAR